MVESTGSDLKHLGFVEAYSSSSATALASLYGKGKGTFVPSFVRTNVDKAEGIATDTVAPVLSRLLEASHTVLKYTDCAVDKVITPTSKVLSTGTERVLSLFEARILTVYFDMTREDVAEKFREAVQFFKTRGLLESIRALALKTHTTFETASGSSDRNASLRLESIFLDHYTQRIGLTGFEGKEALVALMGHKKARKRRRLEGEAESKEAQGQKPFAPDNLPDPARALVAVDCSGDYVAIACGTVVQAYSTRDERTVTIPDARHELPVRAMCFSPEGRLFASAADDKLVIIRSCTDWTTVARVKAAKKISALCFTADSKHICFADKFGDVLIAQVDLPAEHPTGEYINASFLLGHFSSIVTSIIVSSDNSLLVTTDREGKVRVSQLPDEPLQGAHEIQSYCLGHKAFVTCAGFVGEPQAAKLLTGSGDGTLKLWEPHSGELLDTLDLSPFTSYQPRSESEIPADSSLPGPQSLQTDGMPGLQPENESSADQAAASGSKKTGPLDAVDAKMPEGEALVAVELEEIGEEEEGEQGGQFLRKKLEDLPAAVLNLAVASNRQFVAVAVEGEHEIFIVRIQENKLVLHSRLSLPLLRLPTSLALDDQDILWAVAGCEGEFPLMIGALQLSPPSQDQDASQAQSISARDLCSASLRESFAAALQPLAKVPNLGQLSRKLGVQVSAELRKWMYSEEEIARRKSNRADLRKKAGNQ